jgi:hypothetical protein
MYSRVRRPLSRPWQRVTIGALVTAVVASTAAAPAQAAPPDGGKGAIGGVTAPTPATPPTPTDLSPMETGDGATTAQEAAMDAAAAKARSTGKAVPVDALTSETQQVVAQPGGGFAYNGNAKPVRTKQNGTWRAIDVTLRTNGDGTVGPVATAYGKVAFSGGGNGPLAVTTDGATSYALTWPGRLPKPVVSGDSATYREALPGVDLVLQATATGGFSEVLVVKSARAAHDKGLAAVRLGASVKSGRYAKPLATDGVTVNGSGGAVLDTGTPLMWDSRQAAADPSDTRHASVAARVASVHAAETTGALTLTPDAGLLSDESTVWPVYIDPTFNWHPTAASKPAFDEVKQGSPCNGQSYYDNTGSAGNSGNLGVGYNGWGSCNGDEHAYYQWSIPHVMWDGTINSATVEATETYSSMCDSSSNATVNLHWTGAMNSGTDWNNRPGYVSNGLNTGVTYGPSYNGDACPNNDLVSHGFNVLSPIAKAASAHTGLFTVALTEDAQETAKNRNPFKRFSDNPTLQIYYDHKPSTPGTANLSAVTGSNKTGCATATPYPVVGKTIATNTPMLTAKIGDSDGDSMRATFKYWVGSNTAATGLSGDNLANNSTAKFSLPSSFTSALTSGATVSWQVQVTDGELTSAWSSTCHFTAEPTAPSQPDIASADGNYPDLDDDATADQVGKSAGTAGKFTLTNNGTTATKFVYALDVQPATVNPPATQTIAATGNTATVTVTPMVAGPHTLWVAAVDAAGDVSSMSAYRFEADHLPATTCASLAACFNNVAISADSNPAAAAADGNSSYSATDLTNAGWASGGRVTVNGAPIGLPAYGSGQKDNVLAAGQQVTYGYTASATGSSALVFLATSTQATSATAGTVEGDTTAPYVPPNTAVSALYCFDANDPAAYCAPHGSINYSDGSSQPYYLTVPDWGTGPASLAAVVLPHSNRPSGQITTTAKLYGFSVPVTASKTISSVTLPEVSLDATKQSLHIFGMGARNTTTGTIEANGSTTAAPSGQSWTGAWASPTEINGNFNDNTLAFSNQTFRFAVKPSISGTTMRVKLDNALNNSKLVIGHATVALDGGTPPVLTPSGSFTNLTFGGSAGVTLPAGGMVFSDPLPYTVTANKWLLVSFSVTNTLTYLPEHSWASDTDHGYTTAPGSGDHTTDTTNTAWIGNNTHDGNFTDILTDLDVTTANIPTQVVLGDGLIDAWQPNTSPNGSTGVRLSDDIAAAEPSTPAPFGTLAEGVESNYVMSDNPQINPDINRAVGGPSALSRIDRDILDQPGIDTVVLDEGLEDVLNGRSSDDLDANGYPQLLAYLQANNLDTIVVGLHPCDGYAGDGAKTGSTNDPCTTAVDTERTAVNGWLSSDPLGMSSATVPALFYIDPDAAIGVPDTANGLTKLDPNAAIATDHVNLSDSGYAALSTAYLGAQDSWPLNDADYDSSTTIASDTADNATNPYLADNPQTGQSPANLVGGATWGTDSSRGTVLSLDGTTGGASTVGPVLNTAGSYSVSAWAKLSSNSANAVVISQEDTTNSPFSLRYDKALNAWTFGVSTTATGTGITSVHATTAPTLNAWTHLVGTYNATSHTLTLYVNGTANGTPATFSTPWASTGVLDLGHAGTTGWFPGSLSNMQAYDYALTATQVKALYQQIS